MFLHFLTFAAYFLPRINFDTLNNATNVTKIDESRNISYPFYNWDQDYSNMSKTYRLPPFIFKRSINEFLDSDMITKHSENVTTAANATTDRNMTGMTKKNADDVAKNIFLNSTVPKIEKRVTNNDTIDHSNSTYELIVNSSLLFPLG